MKPRFLGRRLAMQYLFMLEVSGTDGACGMDEFLTLQKEAEIDAGADFAGKEGVKWEEAAAFAGRLAQEALASLSALDARIAEALKNWDLARVATVEKCVLRLAMAELAMGETPLPAVADEMVRLARLFGGPDSASFVNGVLMGMQ